MKRIVSGMMLTLLFIGIFTLTFNVKSVSAQSPRLFAFPSHTLIRMPETYPPYPRYNFSIMVENMSKVNTITASVKSLNVTAAKIVGYYRGEIFRFTYSWEIFIWENWVPSTGDVQGLTAASMHGGDNIAAPVEVFRIEVECYNLTMPQDVVIDIYFQSAVNENSVELLNGGNCPYDNTLTIVPPPSLLSPVPVGGVIVPINKIELLAPYIGLISLLIAATLSIIYVNRKKKQD